MQQSSKENNKNPDSASPKELTQRCQSLPGVLLLLADEPAIAVILLLQLQLLRVAGDALPVFIPALEKI
jgi:hypothetical protein